MAPRHRRDVVAAGIGGGSGPAVVPRAEPRQAKFLRLSAPAAWCSPLVVDHRGDPEFASRHLPSPSLPAAPGIRAVIGRMLRRRATSTIFARRLPVPPTASIPTCCAARASPAAGTTPSDDPRASPRAHHSPRPQQERAPGCSPPPHRTRRRSSASVRPPDARRLRLDNLPHLGKHGRIILARPRHIPAPLLPAPKPRRHAGVDLGNDVSPIPGQLSARKKIERQLVVGGVVGP